MRHTHSHRITLLLIPLIFGASCAPPSPSSGPNSEPAALNWSADDSLRIANLEEAGVHAVRTHVEVWAPRDSLNQAYVEALADSLENGVAGLRRIMGGPLSWQRIGDDPVTYYLSPGRFVAHASGYGAVFIPVSRVKEGLAPFLHEAAHELLAPHPPFYPWEFADSAEAAAVGDARPLWLFEGIPDVLAHSVWPETGPHEGDVFNIGGLEASGTQCAVRANESPRGEEVLAHVGREALLEALFTTDRRELAPIFYACGQSLTYFIAQRIGIPETVSLMPGMVDGEWKSILEGLLGQPLETVRADWLREIGYED